MGKENPSSVLPLLHPPTRKVSGLVAEGKRRVQPRSQRTDGEMSLEVTDREEHKSVGVSLVHRDVDSVLETQHARPREASQTLLDQEQSTPLY